MGKRQTKIRFFTIADYNEEQTWLEEQHENGWKLVKVTAPCFFTFEECVPEEVSYRLELTRLRQPTITSRCMRITAGNI